MPLNPAPPKDPLRLVSLATLAHGGRWRTEAMRSYRGSVLLWFTRGQGRMTLAGITRGYGAHNAVFVPARVMHGFDATAQTFGTALFLGTTPGIPWPEAPLHLRIRDGAAQGEMAVILEQLQRESAGPRPAADRALLHWTGLLSVWLERQAAEGAEAEAPTASARLAARFARLVEDQLYTGQTVADYAEALGVTATHLSRVCRQMSGRPASEILADRVIFEARRLLADTPLPVKRVAEMLGFRSAAYFTRAFQKRAGQTPTAFRAAMRG